MLKIFQATYSLKIKPFRVGKLILASAGLKARMDRAVINTTQLAEVNRKVLAVYMTSSNNAEGLFKFIRPSDDTSCYRQ